MSTVNNTFLSIINAFKTIGITDIIDIAILSYLIFHGIILIRETRAQQLIKGIFLMLVFYLVSLASGLNTMKFLLKKCISWGFLAVIIIFQPEFRRILEKLGRTKFSDFSFLNVSESNDNNNKWETCINSIVEATQDLSLSCTGALIICERKTKLGDQIATGTVLKCVSSPAILENIFYPNTPLHDGAVIIRNGSIYAAGCFLPKPQKEELIAKHLGSRHRAAIGMSEVSDSIVIVVSEETGTISVAENGELTRGFTSDRLKRLLVNRLIPKKDENINKENTLKERMIYKWKK